MTLTATGSLIRYLSSVTIQQGSIWKYVAVLIGQSFLSLAQPMFVNSPGLLAANWFGANERDAAVTIGSLFAVVGNAIGQVFPPFMVSSSGWDDDLVDDSEIMGMERLLGWQAGFSVGAFAVVLLFFKSEPETPPSSSTEAKGASNSYNGGNNLGNNRETDREIINNESEGEGVNKPLISIEQQRSHSNANKSLDVLVFVDGVEHDPTYAAYLHVISQVKILLHDKNYRLLLISFGLGLGLFNAILTVVNNLLSPCNYGEAMAGNFAAMLIAAGLVGAGIVGFVMEKTHAYRLLLKSGFTAAAFGSVFLCFSLRKDNTVMLGVAWSVLGFAMIPMLPVMIENAIECTFPISEELGAGLLFTAGNIVGIPIVFLMQYLIDLGNDRGECSTIFQPVNVLIVCCAVSCALVAWQFKGEYKRLAFEKMALERREKRNSV